MKKINKKNKDKKKLKKWRSEGKQVIMYLDDGSGIEQNDELCKAVVNQVKCDLIKSGFVPDQRIDRVKPAHAVTFMKQSPVLCSYSLYVLS